jgi:small subunit ribosomal protein S4
MGAPKRLRKTYERPAMMWSKERIDEEHNLKSEYGLRNMKELWAAKSELRRVRSNVRKVLSMQVPESVGRDTISRLANYNIVKPDATLDSILVINIHSMLDRRLQTIIFKKGMSRTQNQARQLITHGFISINGKRVTSPGYLVTADDESNIAYYKPINIIQKSTETPVASEGAAANAESSKGSNAKEVKG